MNRVATGKVGGFHEKARSVHEMGKVADRTEQMHSSELRKIHY
jgi:hypothetical protein